MNMACVWKQDDIKLIVKVLICDKKQLYDCVGHHTLQQYWATAMLYPGLLADTCRFVFHNLRRLVPFPQSTSHTDWCPDFPKASLSLLGSYFCTIFCRIVECIRLGQGWKLVIGYQTGSLNLFQLLAPHLFSWWYLDFNPLISNVQLVSKNRKERDEERVNEPDMIDGQMLWLLMQHLRRTSRRRVGRWGIWVTKANKLCLQGRSVYRYTLWSLKLHSCLLSQSLSSSKVVVLCC